MPAVAVWAESRGAMGSAKRPPRPPQTCREMGQTVPCHGLAAHAPALATIKGIRHYQSLDGRRAL